ncbi:MAG: proton-translocating transhydrogenase family protein, partial [Acetobacteraceae bacterium]
MHPGDIVREAANLVNHTPQLAHAHMLAATHAASVGAEAPFIFLFATFVLAIFVGYYVVWNVTPALHSP